MDAGSLSLSRCSGISPPQATRTHSDYHDPDARQTRVDARRLFSLAYPPYIYLGLTLAVNPLGYANAVQAYSRLPSGTGQNHERLARFLLPPLLNGYGTGVNPSTTDASFLTVYNLGPCKQAPERSPGDRNNPSGRFPGTHPLGKPGEALHFHDCQQFAGWSPPISHDPQSQLLFLKGYPSREWLNLLGSKYHIDPEFFSRHFDFRSPADRSNNFSIPSVPSSSWHLMQLHITSIGFRETLAKRYKHQDIKQLRIEDENDMEKYRHQLSLGSNIKIGDAIIRDFSTLDETHFSVGQRISICMQNTGQSWITFVWIDSGTDVSESPNGPWSWKKSNDRSRAMYLYPVVRQRPMTALKPHLVPESSQALNGIPRKQPQNASSLHMHYGRSLRPNVMACDPFYALNEIFQFAASSEKQFLNLLDVKLDKFLGDEYQSDFESLPNLKYVQRLLYRHMRQTQQTLDSIYNAQHPRWPKATKDPGKKATLASEAVKQDFEHLLSFAESLHTRCNEGISILMNTVSIAESEKAMGQAERLGKLTFLAFIFVPLSFTTSFFGMNFKELGSTLSIWTWFALSIPVLMLTLLLFIYDVPQVWTHVLDLVYFYMRKYL